MITAEASLIAQQYQQIITPSEREQLPGLQQSDSRPVYPVHPPWDSVAISDEGRELARYPSATDKNTGEAENNDTGKTNEKEALSNDSNKLSDSEEAQVRELVQRDREVRAHEQAHLAAAGQYARGGASFMYQRGPDGKVYAVGGEVSIDVGKERTPEETIAKMQTVMRAAMAPAQPSSTDRQVAAQATARLNQARQELQHEHMVEMRASMDDPKTDDNTIGQQNIDTAYDAQGNATPVTRTLMADSYKAVNEYL